MRWGNKLLWGYDVAQDSRLKEVYDTFVSQGANWFDTGDSYGTGDLEGRAEQLLGRFEQEEGQNRVLLATKLAAYPWRLTPDSMVDAVRASVGRMGRVDIAQMHWSPRSYGFGFQELIRGHFRHIHRSLEFVLDLFGSFSWKNIILNSIDIDFL